MFSLPPLPYAYNALEPYIDEVTMKFHHDKHHATYVEKLNSTLIGQDELLNKPIEKILGNLHKVPENILQAVKNFGGGHANHAFFWKIMSGQHNQEPQGQLISAINQTFGSLIKFQEIFSQKATTLFGSGWVWLVKSPSPPTGVEGQVKLDIVGTVNQDTPLSDGKIPLLAIDVWEHAYYLEYQNRRVEYIKAWWNVVNWKEVEARFM